MSDPTLSDFDFKNKMGQVWTTHKYQNHNCFTTKEGVVTKTAPETIGEIWQDHVKSCQWFLGYFYQNVLHFCEFVIVVSLICTSERRQI